MKRSCSTCPIDEAPRNGTLKNAQTRARTRTSAIAPFSSWRHFEGSQFEQAKLKAEALWGEQLVYAKFGAMRISCHIGQQVPEEAIA